MHLQLKSSTLDSPFTFLFQRCLAPPEDRFPCRPLQWWLFSPPYPSQTRSKVRWSRLCSSLFLPFSLKLPSCASSLSEDVTHCIISTCFPLGHHHPHTPALLKKIFSYSLLLSPAHFLSSEFLEILYTHGCSYLCLSSVTCPPLSCPPPLWPFP